MLPSDRDPLLILNLRSLCSETYVGAYKYRHSEESEKAQEEKVNKRLGFHYRKLSISPEGITIKHFPTSTGAKADFNFGTNSAYIQTEITDLITVETNFPIGTYLRSPDIGVIVMVP